MITFLVVIRKTKQSNKNWTGPGLVSFPVNTPVYHCLTRTYFDNHQIFFCIEVVDNGTSLSKKREKAVSCYFLLVGGCRGDLPFYAYCVPVIYRLIRK